MPSLLEVKDIGVQFGGLRALDGVSFSLDPSEIVGIIGPNGAGKTTLFNTIVGLQPLSAGAIYLDDCCTKYKIFGLAPHEIAKLGVTKTFQNASLFPDMSVVDNVITAALLRQNLSDARKSALNLLARLELSGIADKDVSCLTFPEKALVELARGLATQPRLLLLDEVMAALTPQEMQDVIEVIKDLRKQEGIAFLVVEHHMRAIMSLCDRLVVLNFGRLLTTGTPAEVARSPEVVSAYLGSSAATLLGGASC